MVLAFQLNGRFVNVIDLKVDICQFLNSKNQNFIIKAVIDQVQKDSPMALTCPVKPVDTITKYSIDFFNLSLKF